MTKQEIFEVIEENFNTLAAEHSGTTKASQQRARKAAMKIKNLINVISKMNVYQTIPPYNLSWMKSRTFFNQILKEEAITSTEVSLYLAPSPIHGEGDFTGKHMPEGTDLGIAQIKQPEGHDITPLGKYHNHSAAPNCTNVTKGDNHHLVALRDIEPDEEITVDYTLQSDLEQPGDDWL